MRSEVAAAGVQSAGGDLGGVPAPDLRSLRQAAERQAILNALRDQGDDELAAAHVLGMSRSTIYRRLKNWGREGSGCS